MDPALACFVARLAQRPQRRPVIAVGGVRDHTGKYSICESAAITQGDATTVTSALS